MCKIIVCYYELLCIKHIMSFCSDYGHSIIFLQKDTLFIIVSIRTAMIIFLKKIIINI